MKWSHIKNRTIRLSATIAVLISVFMLLFSITVLAGENSDPYSYYRNKESKFYAVMADNEKLFTEQEKKDLLDIMSTITPYENIFFVTANINDMTTMHYTEDTLEKIADYCDVTADDSTILVINTGLKQLNIYSGKHARKKISSGIAATIINSARKMALNEDYYGCASTIFSQIFDVLTGETLSNNMKFFTAAFLAICSGMVVVSIIIMSTIPHKKDNAKKIVSSKIGRIHIHYFNGVEIHRISFTYENEDYPWR